MLCHLSVTMVPATHTFTMQPICWRIQLTLSPIRMHEPTGTVSNRKHHKLADPLSAATSHGDLSWFESRSVAIQDHRQCHAFVRSPGLSIRAQKGRLHVHLFAEKIVDIILKVDQSYWGWQNSIGHFLLSVDINHVSISCRHWNIQRLIMAYPWSLRFDHSRSLKMAPVDIITPCCQSAVVSVVHLVSFSRYLMLKIWKISWPWNPDYARSAHRWTVQTAAIFCRW